MRESFVLHAEYIEDLPEDLKNTFLRSIYDYGINGIEPDFSGLELTVWLKIKRRIDDDSAAYDRKVANLKQNRTKTPKAIVTPNEHRTETERESNGKTQETERTPNGDRTETDGEKKTETGNRTGGVYDSVNVSVNDSVIDSVHSEKPPKADTHKTKRFVRPTLEEIREYCFEKNMDIDSEKFFNYYESKGWKVGTSPMKDWMAAVRNWAKNDIQYAQQRTSTKGIQTDKDASILSRYKPAEKNTDILKNLAEIQGGENERIQSDEEIIF